MPAGKHDLAFREAFRSYGAAARYFGVSRMTIWRWCHDRSPLPAHVVEVLPRLLQNRVVESHAAQDEWRYFQALPPKPLPPLSGCCAGYVRKSERRRF
jgi:hypothetical protein